MPLILVKHLNYGRDYTYAPPQEDAVINTDDIVAVVPTEARGSGPFVNITFRNDKQMVCIGIPKDFLPKENKSG